MNETENYQKLIDIIDEYNLCGDKHEFTLFLQLISNISKNHHRNPNLFILIERILRNFTQNIKKNFTNWEIFKIFKGNKKILLFLLDEKLLVMNERIIMTIIKGKYLNANYPQYFSPEIKPFIHEEWFIKNFQKEENNKLIEEITKELPENFYELRKKGENDSYICQLIQNDSIDDFIIYINRKNWPLQSEIETSIYETNSFLIKKHIESKNNSKNDDKLTLIKYAAFFGSIQIYQYLRMNKVDLSPSLWLYAIHGRNAELIHLLESDKIYPEDISYVKCLKESIKCHHNDFANYIQNNLLIEKSNNLNDENNFNTNVESFSFHYHNFSLFPNDFHNKFIFFYLCKYNYYTLVKLFLNTEKININETIKSQITFNNNYNGVLKTFK